MGFLSKRIFKTPKDVEDAFDAWLAKYIDEDKKLKDKTEVPSILAFCRDVNMSYETFNKYQNGDLDHHKPFMEIMDKIVKTIEAYTVEAGYKGNQFSNFMLSRKFAYIEKTQHEHSGNLTAVIAKAISNAENGD